MRTEFTPLRARLELGSGLTALFAPTPQPALASHRHIKKAPLLERLYHLAVIVCLTVAALVRPALRVPSAK